MGKYILKYFGISKSALKIADGVLIGLIGFEMTRAGEKLRHKREIITTVEEALSDALVPLGSPLLVGPGAISLSIIYGATYGYLISIVCIIIALITIFPFIYLALKSEK